MNYIDETMDIELLDDIFALALDDNEACWLFCTRCKAAFFPQEDAKIYGKIFNVFVEIWEECGKKEPPAVSAIKSSFTTDKERKQLHSVCDYIANRKVRGDRKSILQGFVDFIKKVEFALAFKESQKLYGNGKVREAIQRMRKYTNWEEGFNADEGDFYEVGASFAKTHSDNYMEQQANRGLPLVNRFYINELDIANMGRSLRTQLTYILAPTGRGKSHAARWIGSQAYRNGLNVLHVQLEGSAEECQNAYEAAISGCDQYRFSIGSLTPEEIAKAEEEIAKYNGHIYVKSFQRFNNSVTTIKVKDEIEKFSKKFGSFPDILIIDSADLLSSSKRIKVSDDKSKRTDQICVSQDLKDIAGDYKMWVVATYQSTIEDQKTLNDENFVLTEYNCAEAKGVSRALTHLITLNQSSNEKKEQTMRINVAKSRLFYMDEPIFKIDTDFDNEIFCLQESIDSTQLAMQIEVLKERRRQFRRDRKLRIKEKRQEKIENKTKVKII